MKYLPLEYIKDFFDVSSTEVDESAIRSWCKELQGEELTAEDLTNIEKIKEANGKPINRMNRAIELATAEILYEITGSELVFRTPAADCKTILKRLDKNNQKISYIENDGNIIEVEIEKTNIDTKKLGQLYKKYKSPVSNEFMDKIIKIYFLDFGVNSTDRELFAEAYLELRDYLSNYGKGLELLFSQPSNVSSKVREQYFMHILTNAPEELKPIIKECVTRTAEEFETEDNVHKIIGAIKHRYYFIPENGFEPFKTAYSSVLRAGTPKMLKEIYDTIVKDSELNALLGGFAQLFSFSRQYVSTADCLSLLCTEQAMADVLYKATNEPKVYALTYQELAEALEKFASVKKVNNQEQFIQSKLLKTAIPLTLKRKLNFYQMDKAIAGYKENILEYLQTLKQGAHEIDGEQILFSLNTDEENSFLDEYVAKRIDFTLQE